MRLQVSYRPSPYTERVEEICRSWKGTRYAHNRRTKGVSVDCVHFVAGVLDELFGQPRSRGLNSLMPDACVHDRRAVGKMLRTWLKLYDHDRVVDGSLEAGDVVFLRPDLASSSVSHILIAGDSAKLWHSTSGPGVCFCGYVLPEGLQLRAVFRSTEKNKWTTT